MTVVHVVLNNVSLLKMPPFTIAAQVHFFVSCFFTVNVVFESCCCPCYTVTVAGSLSVNAYFYRCKTRIHGEAILSLSAMLKHR